MEIDVAPCASGDFPPLSPGHLGLHTSALVKELSPKDSSDPVILASLSSALDITENNPLQAHGDHNGAEVKQESGKVLIEKGREAAAHSAAATSSFQPPPPPLLNKTDIRGSFTYPELLKRCQDNKLYRAGSATVFSLGCVASPFVFHTRRYILPFGFTSVRSFTSYVQPDVQCPYICEIIDGGDGKQAQFRVTCFDDLEHPILALSPSAAWRQVVRMVRAHAQLKGINVNHSDQISGLVMFGVGHPSIQQTLRGMTGPSRCRTMEYFEHKTGYEDGVDVDIIDASVYVPDSRLLENDIDDIDLHAVPPVNNFLTELDQHVNDIVATTPLSHSSSADLQQFQALPSGLSHRDISYVISAISAEIELCSADTEIFEKLVAHVKSTTSHSSSAASSLDSSDKHAVLCWWHMREAASAAHGFSRFAAVDALSSHFSLSLIFTELWSCFSKLEKSWTNTILSLFKLGKSSKGLCSKMRSWKTLLVPRNVSSKSSSGRTWRMPKPSSRFVCFVSEFLRSAMYPHLMQGQFMAREYKRVQRELQEKVRCVCA
jgi:hypothetical protein